jgi:hypothetical protein
MVPIYEPGHSKWDELTSRRNDNTDETRRFQCVHRTATFCSTSLPNQKTIYSRWSVSGLRSALATCAVESLWLNYFFSGYLNMLSLKCGRWVGLSTLPPSVSRLSRQCGILNISQPYRPPRLFTRIALLYGDSVLPVRYELDCKYCYK